MPKGGRKGGTTFPRLNLEQAVEYSQKLASKTHTGPQPENVILPGVFGASGAMGKVRASGLKQFGLLEGSPKGYSATDLAKQIVAATEDDRPGLLQTALLKPKIYKTLFETFCSDDVARSRIRQQAANLQVHPDSLDECTNLFVESAIYAGLAKQNGESVSFNHAEIASQPAKSDMETEQSIEPAENDGQEDAADDEAAKEISPAGSRNVVERNITPKTGGRANIDIKIDPSMDPEKLEKLLKVLREYGQI